MTVKISAMDLASTPLAGTEEVELNQGGNSRRTAVSNLELNKTLAQLNAKITDATLIDTGDSRLSDARTPTSHSLSGSSHSATTLALFQAKISDATLARSDATQQFTGAQYTEVTTLTDAATIAIDASANNAFKVTLGGDRTLGNPTNAAENMSWTVRVTQDGTGSRTLSFDTNYTVPTAIDTSSDTAGQERLLTCVALSATKIVVLDSFGAAV